MATKKQDLKELAKLKIKYELYKKLLEHKTDAIKDEMKKEGIDTIIDPDGILSVKLTVSGRREFSVPGVRATLGDKASMCIVETVDSKKFDTIVKDGKKYLITEDQQKKCFSSTESRSLNWDGLDTYQHKLEEAINATASK